MNKNELRIAIDGGAGTGKTSISKLLSEKLGIQYISTGLMYRLLTLKFVEAGIIESDTEGVSDEEMLNDILETLVGKISYVNGDIYLDNELVEFEELQSKPIRNNINKITGLESVREFCRIEQTRIGSKKGVLLEGRDITSVIMTDADFKFYIEADPKVKAERRVSQLVEMGIDVNYDEILKAINERDKSDSTRKIGPLVKVNEAIIIKNEDASLEKIVSKIQFIIEEHHSSIPINETLAKEINSEN